MDALIKILCIDIRLSTLLIKKTINKLLYLLKCRKHFYQYKDQFLLSNYLFLNCSADSSDLFPTSLFLFST
jgi:hypothetical protein